MLPLLSSFRELHTILMRWYERPLPAVICPWALTASPARVLYANRAAERLKHIEESISKILSSYDFIEAILWYLKTQINKAEVSSSLYLPSTGHRFSLQSTPCCILVFVYFTTGPANHSHSKLQFTCDLSWYSWGNGRAENIHRCRSSMLGYEWEKLHLQSIKEYFKKARKPNSQSLLSSLSPEEKGEFRLLPLEINCQQQGGTN